MYEETAWCLDGREKGVWGGRQTIVVLLKFIFSLEKKTKNLIFSFTTFYVKKKKKKLSYYLWIIQDLQAFIPNGFSGLSFSSVVNNADSRLLYCSAFV